MSVRLSDAAEVDLEEIGDFIAVDSPRRANSFVLELLDQCASLADYPARHPVIGARHELELRRYAYKGYLIVYVVSDDGIEILRIVHGARDFDRLLFPDT